MDRRDLLKSAALAPLFALPAVAEAKPDDPPPPHLDIQAGCGDSWTQAWHKTAEWIRWLERNRSTPAFDAEYPKFREKALRMLELAEERMRRSW